MNEAWLKKASRTEQVAALVQWFGARFCDPAEDAPYTSSEGSYLWVHGGPYEAGDQIGDQFRGLVEEAVIERAVEVVEGDGIYQWAPTELTYYDDFFDAEVDARTEPMQRLEATLGRLQGVLSLQGDDAVRNVARQLAYAGAMSALDTFLRETMSYWVDHSEDTVRNLVAGHPGFKDRKISLGKLFELYDALRAEVKAHMQAMAWHRPTEVAPMFSHGLGVTLGYTGFDADVKKRYDLVHRSGRGIDGSAVTVTDADIANLAERVLAFAKEVEAKIEKAQSGE
ncbi:hypothetical protein LK996_07045 [Lysobacter sp. A6]|uniref:Uncharacterized protein n=1 Tax=Noviluteimonas lactosilytica TaxID=2888523 RepID=A0ABS8JGV5_9GAMM|nr:hypothetical protein [Lysobacter lactosilyticus]MCC8362832.1 hypothetical protein [Lysobacter lactosilyticus]